MEKASDGRIIKQAWYFNQHYPWLGMAICAPVIGLWYWCTDQYIIQRALGAPNEAVARRGSIFAAFLKLFPVYLFIIPGLICFALVKSGKVPELAANYDAQNAFPLMVKHLLPPGLRGIVVAGLLSALMGSCSQCKATWRRPSSLSSSSASFGSGSTPKAACTPWWRDSSSASSACWWIRQ